MAWFERPRTTPKSDRTFYVRIDKNDPANPDDNTFSVLDAGTSSDTAIGAPLDETLLGFHGFDVREPQSKGTSDVVSDGYGDILAKDSAGAMWAFPSSYDSFIEPRVKVGTGWNIYSSFIAAGDLNSDNRGDVVAKDKSGNLWFYAGRGNAKFAARVLISSGWGSLSYLAPGDVNSDGIADLIAVKPDGRMYLFAGKGTGTGFTSSLLGSGFASMTVVGVGDFNYDNTADLISRDRSTGKLYLSAGLGSARFAAKKLVGSGWGGFTGFGTPEFEGFTGLYARGASGSMRFYATTGDGTFIPGYATVPGSWNSYAFSS